MKALTKEAAIHLGTKLGHMSYHSEGEVFQFVHKDGHISMLNIEEFRPHDPDSPYAMKYLTALVVALGDKQWDLNKHLTCCAFALSPDLILRIIFKLTSFKGKTGLE